MNFQIGDIVFEDWKIVRKIGSGASGIVYEIRKTGQEVSFPSALKVMHVPQNEAVVEELKNDGMDGNTLTTWLRGAVEELIGEIKIMISLKGFPYIVNCEDYRVIQEDGAHWDILIRMELLTSVPEYLRQYALTEADVHRLGLHLARALELFEEKRIIHRDLKPENIFVNTFGDFKAGDFGIARACGRMSGGLSKKGTENYMAPEVYRGQDYDDSVDIYSLGLVLYKLLNKNRLPFYPLNRDYTAADRQQAMADRMSGREEMAAPVMASPELAAIVLKMCAFCPEDRYRSARELIADLESCSPSEKVVIGGNLISGGGAAAQERNARDEDLTGEVFARMPGLAAGGFRSISAGGDSGAAQSGFGGDADAQFHYDRSAGRSAGMGASGGFQDALAGSGRGAAQSGFGGDADAQFHYDGSAGRSAGVGASGGFQDTLAGSGRGAVQSGFGGDADVQSGYDRSMGIQADFTGDYGMPSGTDDAGGSGNDPNRITSDRDADRYFDEDGNPEGAREAQRPSGRIPERPGTVKTEDSGTEAKKSGKARKAILLAVAAVAVVLAVAVPQYLSQKFSLTVNGGEGGGSYTAGTAVSVSAEEKEGSSFTGWEASGITLSEEQSGAEQLSFKMPRKKVTLTALYETDRYQVTVEGGSGSGEYEWDTQVTVKADEPETGYKFAGWIVGAGTVSVSDLSSQEISFRIGEEDIRLTASYEALEYELIVNDADGSQTVAYGEKVRLEAEDVEESAFTGWRIDSGEPALTEEELQNQRIEFTMPAGDVELTAVYAVNEHQVTVEDGSGSGTYKVGDTVEITADSPAEGSEFAGWKSLKGKPTLEDSSLETTSFTMPDRDVKLSAQYELLEYTVTVNGGEGSGSYSFGDTVEISANSLSGSTFSGWTVDEGNAELLAANMAETSFIMPAGDVELTAVYAVNEHKVTVENGSGSGTYKVGDTVEITANTPAAGTQFSGWKSLKGKPSLEDSSLETTSFTMPDQDVKLSAQFESVDYTITVNNGNGGGTYHLGDIVYISADPLKDGMTFEKWTVDRGTLELSDLSLANISFEMPAGNVTLTAHYVTTKYTVKVKNGTGSGMFSPGDSVKVTAEASSGGSTFSYWEVTSGTLDTTGLDLTQRTLTFEMPENNLSLTAMYAVSQTEADTGYVLTVNGGTGSGSYAAGTKVKISHDQPASGMAFAYWLAVGYTGTADWTSDELEIVMPENDVIITAVFSAQ